MWAQVEAAESTREERATRWMLEALEEAKQLEVAASNEHAHR